MSISPGDAGTRLTWVAMVCSGYRPDVGGVETHVGCLVDELARLGVNIDVLTQATDGELPSVEDQGAVVVRRFRSVVASRRDSQAPGLWAWLARHGSRYDLIHTHSYHALASMSALAARRPIVFTPHYHGTGHSPARAALHELYRPLGRRLFTKASAIICVSRAEAGLITAKFPNVAGKTHTIPNGVDVAELRQAEPMVLSGPYFLSLGRLETYKRVDRTIEAMSSVAPAARLVIIGSGPARETLIDLAQTRGLAGRILFLDPLPRPDLRRWLAGAQAVVAMSEHEAFGLTLLEGLAAGRPVVASDLPAHREVSAFGHPDAVQLVSSSAGPAELASVLTRCLGADRDTRRGARVPSWDRVAHRSLCVYRRVVDSIGSPYEQAARPSWR